MADKRTLTNGWKPVCSAENNNCWGVVITRSKSTPLHEQTTEW
ncbi:hypothetical protein O59_001090 [Cellvibrio sp. BR]|nr:hypothetical protein O59_001090 [Cellvibrio sp. BR]